MPYLIKIPLFITVLVANSTAQRNSYESSELSYVNFAKHPNTILDVSPIMSQKVSEGTYCAMKCLESGLCVSYNMAVKPDADNKFDCQILPTDIKYNSSYNLKSSKDFDHYDISRSNPCESFPCQNGGKSHFDNKTQNCTCTCLPDRFTGLRCLHKVVRDCRRLKELGVTKDGVYTIRPDEQGPLKVYCDQTTDGGGWTVLQRRVSPFNTNFNRSWEEYRTGFGNLTGEFWLGNDNIHRLTATPVSFRIDYHEKDNKLHARYENFVVAGADDKYRWNMDSYSGDLPNAIYGSNKAEWKLTGMQFSTPDSDNDKCDYCNCAQLRSSGWWFNWCWLVDLNGRRRPSCVSRLERPIGKRTVASYTDMKVRLT